MLTSQPAISVQIMALEKELGFMLFHRKARGMSLTAEGEQLRLKAEKILSVIDEFTETALSLNHNAVKRIQIGLNTDGEIIAPHVTQVKLHSFKIVVVYPPAWNIDEDNFTFEHLIKVQWIWTTKGCPFYKETIEYGKTAIIEI